MKLRYLLAIIITITIQTASAQQPTVSSKEAYFNHLEMLFKEGCHYYAEVGNEAQLSRIIDAYGEAFIKGHEEKIFGQEDVDGHFLLVKYYKLCGDYYYLDSDNDHDSYARAEYFFRKALDYTEDESLARHRDVFHYQSILHEELGQLYYKQGRYQEAYEQMQTAYKLSQVGGDELLDLVAELAMCEARISKYPKALEKINDVISNYRGKDTDRYAEALRKKAKILMLQKESDSAEKDDITNEALKCYKEYFKLKKDEVLQKLSSMSAEDREQCWMLTRPFAVDCYRLEDADPAFLYDVTLFSKSLLIDFAPSSKSRNVTWKQVRKKLQNGDCALEFIQYEKYGEKQMGALVLKKKGKPQFVKIGKVETIKRLLTPNKFTLYEIVSSGNTELKDDLYNDTTIYQFIWTPELMEAIGEETQRLYFAADGLFHQIAIEYMTPKQYHLRSSNIYRLSSTRQLLVSNSSEGKKDLFTLGDINFFQADGDLSQTKYDNDNQALQYVVSSGIWFPLLSSKYDETIGIDSIYHGGIVTSLYGSDATEANFARMANQYSIIHLSTHGCFGGQTMYGTDLIPASYDESLSKNILALAGASMYSKLDSIYDISEYDGILSAREITQMDLSNVDLIVLSACQSGLGFLTDDGIYGLQRGLKSAGVKGIIVSLWSVSAVATSELMKAFYRYMQTEDTHTAFNHAREDLIASDRFKRPCYYDAFILIDVK